MPRIATKAADNVFYKARMEAAEKNEAFSNRDEASALLGMNRTRLADIELGNIIPNSDDIWQMARIYNKPELFNIFCSQYCAIGKEYIPEIGLDISDFDRIALNILGSCEHLEDLRGKLISIASDGKVDENESKDFLFVLDILNKISIGAQSLKLWANKNIPKQ